MKPRARRPRIYVIDARHFIDDEDALPTRPPALRRQALRIARLIEYGGPLEPGFTRETLVECDCRLDGRPCPGFLWIEKQVDGVLHAFCLAEMHVELFIHDWQETLWAEGPMVPVSRPFGPESVR